MVDTEGKAKQEKGEQRGFRPSRRGVLQGGAAVLGMSQFARVHALGTAPTGLAKELFLMDRLTFGVDQTMHVEYVNRGYTGFLDWQLDPGGSGHDLAHEAGVQADLRAITYQKPNWALTNPKYNGGTGNPPYNPFEMFYVKDRSPWHVNFNFTSPTYAFDCARLSITDVVYNSVYSRYQLLHVMNDFWMNVFNVYALQKSLWTVWLHMLDTAIRPNALGNFGDLLLAVTRSPAMMIYLDQFASEKSAPNENFARELLELHTVGEGNFSETDVVETAKILTGWSIHDGDSILAALPGGVHYDYILECYGEGSECDNVIQPDQSGTLFKEHFGSPVYKQADHTPGTKTVLGNTYGTNSIPVPAPADFGMDEGEQLIQDLAMHPKTAETLVRRLVEWLLYDTNPPASLINRVTGAYLNSGGNIAETLRELFNETYLDELYDGPGAKVRRPLNKLLWTMRTAQPDFLSGPTTRPDWINMLVLAGHVPTGWPSPDGHPGGNEHWTGAIHPRLDMSSRLAFNDGTALDLTAAQLSNFFGGRPVADYAFWANVYFFLGRLPSTEVTTVKNYILGLDATGLYSDEQLMRETVSMIGSLPTAQFLY